MKVIETERLLLRPWRDADLEPFADLNADVRVMKHFPSTASRAESQAFMARIRGHFDRRGYGFWAVELKGGDPFIGFVGLGAVPFDARIGSEERSGKLFEGEARTHEEGGRGLRDRPTALRQQSGTFTARPPWEVSL